MNTADSYLYLKIAETFRRRIASGELKPGDKLPPVRTTAQDWDCTPGTVGRAYQILTQEELVIGQRGKGTLVAQSLIQSEDPSWKWVRLVNRAERFLLEAISAGHSTVEVETALSVACMRSQELRSQERSQVEERRAAAAGSLRFAGSHDLVIDLIVRMLRADSYDVDLSVEYSGSLGGLMALAQGDADLAGTHLWDETTDTYNVPYIRRVLPGGKLVLLSVVQRQLGLILPPGNPQNMQGLQNLTQPEVRFVNRQPGSGSRVWLDAQLKYLEIEPSLIPGYANEQTTHTGLASTIAQGEATVGLGIFAAAASLGLEFVPLTEEKYDLVIPDRMWQLPETQALVEVLRSSHFKESVLALGGYDLSETGQETWIT